MPGDFVLRLHTSDIVPVMILSITLTSSPRMLEEQLNRATGFAGTHWAARYPDPQAVVRGVRLRTYELPSTSWFESAHPFHWRPMRT